MKTEVKLTQLPTSHVEIFRISIEKNYLTLHSIGCFFSLFFRVDGTGGEQSEAN